MSPEHETPEQNTKRWNDTARKVLVGRKITDATYMSAKDAEEMGWYERGLVIQLDDGTVLIISADDEGNGPGAIFYSNEKTRVSNELPVLGMR